MRVVVPTYRRHSNGEAQTFDHVPRDFPLILVVRQNEAEPYRHMLRTRGREQDEIWSIPEGSVRGIADTRQYIMDRALAIGESKILMIDDDLHFITRGKIPKGEPGWDYKLRPCEPEDFRGMIDWFTTRLDDFAHCAVSMREGNNRVPGLGAEEFATRGIRVVGYRTEYFREHVRFRPEVEGREDLDVTLQLLRLGLPNVVTYHWAQGQRSADAPGGLSGSRPSEQLTRTAEKLAELHPGLVKLREKTNKSGGMAGTRTEVTIYWKRALGCMSSE